MGNFGSKKKPRNTLPKEGSRYKFKLEKRESKILQKMCILVQNVFNVETQVVILTIFNQKIYINRGFTNFDLAKDLFRKHIDGDSVQCLVDDRGLLYAFREKQTQDWTFVCQPDGLDSKGNYTISKIQDK